LLGHWVFSLLDVVCPSLTVGIILKREHVGPCYVLMMGM
jgi:hypothetical protein